MGPELFNAEETTGPRTMCRKRRNYHHDDKTSFFFSYKKHTFGSIGVKKESDAVSNPDKTWDYFQGKDEVLYKQLKKNPGNFCEEQRISRFLQQLQTGIWPSVDLPSCQHSYICSHTAEELSTHNAAGSQRRRHRCALKSVRFAFTHEADDAAQRERNIWGLCFSRTLSGKCHITKQS